MRLSYLPLITALLIPSIVSASESFVSSGSLYVSPSNSQERDEQANVQEQISRQYDPDYEEPGVNAQDLVQPPADLQQHLLDQQNTNPQQLHAAEQQKALAQALGNYNKVLKEKNIDPNAALQALPAGQSSYPPKPGSSYYDPNKDYSPESHFVPTQ